ncbi:MAG: peptidase MA family metallohydrolase, partial [Candidatus Omnitrophota bacterium]|nr:peptidase MA family metallohydrolase [Candidatus Omnitrophota bacterium]
QTANLVREAGNGSSEKRVSLKEGNIARSNIGKKLLAKGNWFLRESKHFSIFYRDLNQAKIISDKAEYYFEKIIYDLGYEKDLKWDKKCQVFIVENTEKWRDFLKSIGFNTELIGGFVPNYGETEMFLCAISDGYLAVTFPHELTHLIFKEVAGKNVIPLWLNEGLANYEASLTSVSGELLTKSIKQGTHILLGDLLRMTAYPEGKEARELFYAQSEKLVEFLITQYGREKFRKFCDLILKDKSFKDAVSGVYAKDFKDIEDFNIKLVEYIVK